MTESLRHFREVWLADFEYRCRTGERPEPHCLVAREYRRGRLLRLWRSDFGDRPPFDVSECTLFVAYYASAELGCFRALGWPAPTRILDLYVEFRNLTNGLPVPCGNGLLGALAYFGLPAIDAAEKTEMRDLALRGGRYIEAERSALLDYCESDVDSLARLFPAMLPKIDLPRALLRGRYMAAVAAMEWQGVPIDTETLEELHRHWDRIKGELVRRVDADYGVFVPTGQRELNAQSRFGAAILEEAQRHGVDPHQLADAATYVWRRDRQFGQDEREAVKAARKTTGLTVHRITAWENAGMDHSSWLHLDVQARELAAEYPALGLGRGYVAGENYDDTDYAGLLWERLRRPNQGLKPRHHPDVIAEALELVGDGADITVDALTFSSAKFARWLAAKDIPWPRLASGELALDDDTFRQMARAYPVVAPLRELRHSLGEMRLFSDLAVGSDGRNRCLLSPFRSITGRNQPSNARSIFGPSVWLRCLIKPEPDRAVAYVDWSQQEFGIAAALSVDPSMMEAYGSGDPYLTFAKQAGAVPPEATKATHAAEREQFKVCCLAVQYGMGSKSLADSIGQSEAHARQLLQLHRDTYPRFWRWSEAAVDQGMLFGWLQAVFGWRVHIGPRPNPRSLANFPMQANGAEMLRLACCLLTEAGIEVCAPVHDAVLIEGAADEIKDVVATAQGLMADASATVLGGFRLRTEAKIVRHPDRFMDRRGATMWKTVMALLGEVRQGELAALAEAF